MPVVVGRQAPEFTLPDTERRLRSLREFRGKKTILAFYPGAFTSVCTREMCTFRDSLTALNELDGQVVGISVDGPFANKAFAERNSIPFPLVSDHRREVIRRYGVVQRDFAGVKGYDAAKRAVFILNRDGIVRYKWVSDDPGVEPNYQELKEALNKIT